MLCNHCKRDVHFFRKDYGLTCSNCSRVASYFVPAPIYVEREKKAPKVDEPVEKGAYSIKERREACAKFMQESFERIKELLIQGENWVAISNEFAHRTACVDIATFKSYYRKEAALRSMQREAA